MGSMRSDLDNEVISALDFSSELHYGSISL
jgi:hypothetical protein